MRNSRAFSAHHDKRVKGGGISNSEASVARPGQPRAAAPTTTGQFITHRYLSILTAGNLQGGAEGCDAVGFEFQQQALPELGGGEGIAERVVRLGGVDAVALSE